MEVNEKGYSFSDYTGAASTLCKGCGHDGASDCVAKACFELGLEPHKIVKVSGIGCSSKTPTYFLGKSHGFNAVHGRMPSIITGANVAHKDLTYIGMSGDGDTASIGIGQFIHSMRLNVNLLYMVLNNGCYGLTKGQNSATADKEYGTRKYPASHLESMDLAKLAIISGATFVARGYSGNKKQLTELIKKGIEHKGFAFIDVISPCVRFNNDKDSTKSYPYMKSNMEVIEGEGVDNPNKAMDILQKSYDAGKIPTGIFYVNKLVLDMHDVLNTSDIPLRDLKEDRLCPSIYVLEDVNNKAR